jgi:hypothetical protein
MNTIWKWTLQPETTIDMPHGAKLLAVQEHQGEPTRVCPWDHPESNNVLTVSGGRKETP